MNLNVLRRIYVLEEQSPEQRVNYENQLKKENLESFTEFLNWKNATENHIENIKDVLLKGDSPIINNKYIDWYFYFYFLFFIVLFFSLFMFK
mgnify:CR=1 FL=1